MSLGDGMPETLGRWSTSGLPKLGALVQSVYAFAKSSSIRCLGSRVSVIACCAGRIAGDSTSASVARRRAGARVNRLDGIVMARPAREARGGLGEGDESPEA